MWQIFRAKRFLISPDLISRLAANWQQRNYFQSIPLGHLGQKKFFRKTIGQTVAEISPVAFLFWTLSFTNKEFLDILYDIIITIERKIIPEQQIICLRHCILKHFDVVSRIGPPYLMYAPRENGKELEGNARYMGYSMDLIAHIAEMIGFQFEFRLAVDNKNGNWDELTKKWTGVIGDLLERVFGLCHFRKAPKITALSCS